MSVAFVVTTAYQLYHYKRIAPRLSDVTAVLEVRKQDFNLSEDEVAAHLPGVPIETVSKERLKDLDGKFGVIVCQTPILPLEFFDSSYVVAQQYSLAKENYQYGIWRAQADLNLMYGDHSVGKVEGFSRAIAVGNPLLDPFFDRPAAPQRRSWATGDRKRLLYMPTYGSLSSLSSVMPVLAAFDGDVTVKLHHAETSDVVDSLPSHIRLVGAEADPNELLAEHDGVISDFSGAAFDALYTGMPTVITGAVAPQSKDLDRLSGAEREQSALARVTARWQAGDGVGALSESFAAAQERLESSEYDVFVKQYFTKPGTAGAACAEQITRLVNYGPMQHFAADQVKSTVRRYITSNRQLKERKSSSADQSAVVTPQPSGRRMIRRLRQVATRSDRLVRVARKVRRRVRERRQPEITVDAQVSLAAAPANRREAIIDILTPFLAEGGLAAARDNDLAGSDIAVLSSDKRKLHKVLMTAAEAHPELMVRVGNQWQLVDTLQLSKLSFHDVTYADWLEVGTAAEHSQYVIGSMGYLKVLFVEHQRERNRYLAQKKVAHRVDWTPLFTSAEFSASSGPIRVCGERIPHVAAPIDVVYTWVDSSDPKWQADRGRFDTETANASASNAERFIDRQELKYSLRALELFAPFVRHIYIVTADQHPQWLAKDHPKVTVVSHRDIFPDPSVLPTFNSHSIETCLHRIEGLSENFIYFNDDVFVGQEVEPADFFTIAGQAKVRLSPSQYIYQGEPEEGAIPTDWAAYNSLRLVAQDFDIKLDRRVKHVPLVQKKSVLAEIEQRYPDEIARTRAARFRSVTDVAVPSMFAQYYGMASGQAVEWPGAKNEYVYLDTGRADSLDRFQQILHRPPKFYCLNTTRHTEVDLAAQARNLENFFTAAFPDPADWEVNES